MPDVSPELSIIEQQAVDRFAAEIVAGRDERSERVQVCMEGLAETDEITRMVAHVAIQEYIESLSPQGLYSRTHMIRIPVRGYAPGLYMAFDTVQTKLIQTGEFIGVDNMKDSATSLGFKEERGTKAAGFLCHWVASQYPGSKAQELIRDYGLRSGGMMRNFNTWALLFHESAVEKYLATTQARNHTPRNEIDPIICLTGTDDWGRALSMMTPFQRRRIGEQ